MSHKLDILIPTLNESESITFLKRLKNILDPQVERYNGQVKIHIHDAGRSMPTGTKRNELIANSDGEYFCMIDCDDWVPMYYVDEIMKALLQSPDVVTFQGKMTTNGKNETPFTIKLGEKYEQRNGRYFRYPNHLTCMRRELVEHVKFRPVWNMEDYHWATEIRDKRLLKTEVHIPQMMYWYQFMTNKPSYAKGIR